MVISIIIIVVFALLASFRVLFRWSFNTVCFVCKRDLIEAAKGVVLACCCEGNL
jgi:hypothetical protein